MRSPNAVAIVNMANFPLFIRTNMDDIDKEEATRLIYLMHASLDIIEEKLEQPSSRDNFLGVLYQCEQYKIYGLVSVTKVKILLAVSQHHNGAGLTRDNDIRQLLKNIHKAYIEATLMNPFYKPNEQIKSKRFDSYLGTIFTPSTPPMSPVAATQHMLSSVSISGSNDSKQSSQQQQQQQQLQQHNTSIASTGGNSQAVQLV